MPRASSRRRAGAGSSTDALIEPAACGGRGRRLRGARCAARSASASARGRRRPRPAARRLDATRRAGRRRPRSTRWSLGARAAGPRATSTCVVVELRSPSSGRRAWSGRRLAGSPRRRASRPSVAEQHGDAVEPERRRAARAGCSASGSVDADAAPARRASASASARPGAPRPSAARRESTKHAHDAATARKTTRARRFSPLADRERVERRGEEPVDEQEAADARRRRRPRAADGGDDDDEQQEEQQHARQRELLAQVGEDER